MSRKTLPAHLRTRGPGTGGRNVERDKKICALKGTGLSNEAIEEQFGLLQQNLPSAEVAAMQVLTDR